MSIHGQTRGTQLEPISEMMAKAEANGTMMYYALARLAKEQGLTDVSKTFIEAANQEAVHAGFYATLNAKVPQEFWMLVRGVMAAEYRGDTTVKEMADKYRAAGLTEAADEMEIFAKQEGHHGEMMEALLKKYKPEALDVEGKVLLLEDIGEYVYRLDSMLTQLRQAGMFEKCVGVVLGGFTNCTEEYERYALHLEDIIRDIIVPAGKPVLANMSIGHTPSKITVPLGVQCVVDAEAGTLEFIENALED